MSGISPRVDAAPGGHLHRPVAGRAAAAATSRTEDAAAADAAATLIHRARGAATSGTAAHMPIVQAELATAEAEWSRLQDGTAATPTAGTRQPTIGTSCLPAPSGLRAPRRAEALLHHAEDATDAARELAAAYDTATMLGAGPLLRSIQALAERARIPLPAPPPLRRPARWATSPSGNRRCSPFLPTGSATGVSPRICSSAKDGQRAHLPHPGQARRHQPHRSRRGRPADQHHAIARGSRRSWR